MDWPCRETTNLGSVVHLFLHMGSFLVSRCFRSGRLLTSYMVGREIGQMAVTNKAHNRFALLASYNKIRWLTGSSFSVTVLNVECLFWAEFEAYLWRQSVMQRNV